jgi:hypothetical protein
MDEAGLMRRATDPTPGICIRIVSSPQPIEVMPAKVIATE